jgi:hypothetical protein
MTKTPLTATQFLRFGAKASTDGEAASMEPTTLPTDTAPPPDPEHAQAMRRLAVSGRASNASVTALYADEVFGQLDSYETSVDLDRAVDVVKQGNLQSVEGLLLAQAVSLNSIYTKLAVRAHKQIGDLDQAERCLRLALRAQGQSRATLETLALIKNPPTVFTKQANIAHGPQQVNNGSTPPALARARDVEVGQSKVLEATSEADGTPRLDPGTSNEAVAGHSPVEAVAVRHRPPHR